MDKPFYCITSDIDWVNDYCITDFVDLCNQYGVSPTIFATHESEALKKMVDNKQVDLGIHPNFFPNSTQGSIPTEIIENLLEIYPSSRSFRSHSFFENTPIIRNLVSHGLKYDSNLCLYFQPNIVPLNTGAGTIRFPVFWEDDIHWSQPDFEWSFTRYLEHFKTPGLKILNFHPIHVILNTPHNEFYQDRKGQIDDISENNINQLRFAGKGTRTFFIEFLEYLSSIGEKCHTLANLYQMFPIKDFITPDTRDKGRITKHSDDEHDNYWATKDEAKQEILKASYDKRDATDIYATSRDFHLRELEIQAIKENIEEKGSILDLGCGNGYTLISLAEDLENWEMVGVDFAENLIEGAREIAKQRKDKLRSNPHFLVGDAIDFLKKASSDSYDYIISERFILNLPSKAVQEEVIREIYRVLKPGGRYLMCEASEDGFNTLNDLRKKVGLDLIPATSKDNLSALRLKDQEFKEFASKELGFIINEKIGFSEYMVISRVLHPLISHPQAPKFDAPINDLARKIQGALPLRSGIGSNILWVLDKPN